MKLVVCLLVFFSCNHSTNWQLEHLYSDCKEHCSSRLSYLCKDRMSGIDLEIICRENTLKAYLHLYPHVMKKRSTIIKLATKESTEQFNAYCLKGGQKILLPQEALHFFLHALANNQEIQITVGGCYSCIEPMGFKKSFKKLQDSPKPLNPLQFSFL
jgi:hypothetical protein